MEKFATVVDCKVEDISSMEEARVRTIGKVVNVDDVGIFIIEGENGAKIVCMPSPDMTEKPDVSDLVCITGKVVKSDGGAELRVDDFKKVDERDANNFNKYLKIRGELLDNGSGNK